MTTAQRGYSLPDGMRIGERFLLHFDSPEVSREPQPGRLQDLRPDGALCIDIPAELRPPRGSSVTISSLQRSAAAYRFSSEILGRARINGRVPVLLVKAPDLLHKEQRRAAHRVAAVIKARAEWLDPYAGLQSAPAVVSDLSGGGAQVFMSQRPRSQAISLSLSVPDAFVREWARRKLAYLERRARGTGRQIESLEQMTAQVRAQFTNVRGKVVRVRESRRRDGQLMHGLSVAFLGDHEGCYRLVRFLERQAAQRGVSNAEQPVAAAA